MKGNAPLPSDRSFGLTFTGVFSALAAWFAWKKTAAWWMPSLGLAALFGLLSLVRPALLHRLNVVWMAFGRLLNGIVSPVVLGIIYFGLFTPIAWFFRLRGRDAMNRRFDGAARSYWQVRTPPGPDAPRSFPRQF